MTCKDCLYWERCHSRISYVMDYDEAGEETTDIENHCKGFVDKSRYAEVVRCKDCNFATELDKHCDINRTAYKHCSLLRGDETRNVWHKYKKYYKDYSLVEADDFCSYGERKCEDG